MSTPIPGGSEPTVKDRFWKGFAVGVGTTLVATSLAIVALSVYTGPQLVVDISFAETISVGEPFVVTVATSNPHDEAVELYNIEIPNQVLVAFELLSVSLAATPDSPVAIFGSQVWYFESIVQSGESRTVELTLQPNRPGSQVVELAVCNGYEDCATFTLLIEVQESP